MLWDLSGACGLHDPSRGLTKVSCAFRSGAMSPDYLGLEKVALLRHALCTEAVMCIAQALWVLVHAYFWVSFLYISIFFQ